MTSVGILEPHVKNILELDISILNGENHKLRSIVGHVPQRITTGLVLVGSVLLGSSV